MTTRDSYNAVKNLPAIAPQVATGNTAMVSAILDTAGWESALFCMQMGVIADVDTTVTVLFEDGDAANLSDNAAVSDLYLRGTEALAGFQFDDDTECRKIGYTGPKRYLRVTVTPANNSGNLPIAAQWVQMHERHGGS